MLVDHAAKTEEGLAVLVKFLQKPTMEGAEEVKKVEEEADELRRILMEDLSKTFVTALDREDIFFLSKAIDDVIDYAETSAEEIVLFEIETNEYIEEMVGLLHSAAKDLHLAVQNLKDHPETCGEHLRRIRKAENAIERSYRKGLVELFKSKDFVRVMKTREVYRHLSNAADRAVEAANVLGGIIVKMS